MKKRQLNNTGLTLVEMIVAFTLLSIFLVAVTQVITYIIGNYYNARNITNGLQALQLIENKVSSELQDAHGNEMTITSKTVDSHPMDEVVYENAQGTKMKIHVVDGYLHITYPKQDVYEETEWYFDRANYNGYVITDFHLEKAKNNASDPDASQFKDNIMHLSLTMYNEKYGHEYSSNAYIKCYDVTTIN